MVGTMRFRLSAHPDSQTFKIGEAWQPSARWVDSCAVPLHEDARLSRGFARSGTESPVHSPANGSSTEEQPAPFDHPGRLRDSS
jgi:hypothetical protein